MTYQPGYLETNVYVVDGELVPITNKQSMAPQPVLLFDPDQPRAEDGKWTDTGAGGGGHATVTVRGTLDTEGRAAIPTGRAWISHAPGVPHDTLSEYQRADGTFDAERMALHDEITKSFQVGVQPVPEHEQPVAIVMMGAPASGKSTIVQAMTLDNFVQVNTDLVKEQLPEYRQSIDVGARDAAAVVHEEASLLAKRVRREAVDGRKNLVYDGTGSDATKYRTMIRDLKARGYHVMLLAAHTTIEDSLTRNIERSERTGRFVRPDVIQAIHATIPDNFRSLRSEADSFQLWRTDVPGGKMVWTGANGKETIGDQAYVARF